MKVTVSAEATHDLGMIFAWIAKDSPRAATSMVRKLRSRIGLLVTDGLSNIARPGKEKGTRELLERPYIIVYEVKLRQKAVEIIAVFHAAQDR